MLSCLLVRVPVALLFLATACGHDCPEDPPSIRSFSASQTTVAAGSEFEITVLIDNFVLSGHDDEGAEHSHGDDECAGGHYHVYLDDLMTNPLAMPTTATATVTMDENATPGPHTLIARLHDRAHLIVNPQVTAELEITVE